MADSVEQANNAVELIELDVDELAANADPRQSLDPDTAVLHPEHGSNLCVHYENGDAVGVDRALEQADHIVEVELVNNRVAPSPLEPRTCVGLYADGKYTLYNPSQGAVAQQEILSKAIFQTDPGDIRVISLDTGGGFGIRGEVHPEACICLFAARALGVPVK